MQKAKTTTDNASSHCFLGLSMTNLIEWRILHESYNQTNQTNMAFKSKIKRQIPILDRDSEES